ncbi:hypothetical protein LNP20_06055 [Klebsiella pneumoniae subsp. pneumoniae]|nr:hypothetical protein [Klebsiella pneumoniae subsp. pneumoniae]
MTNGLRTVLPRSFNAATERVEVLKGPPRRCTVSSDPGGLINVITKRPERQFSGSVSGPPPALAAAPERRHHRPHRRHKSGVPTDRRLSE